MFENTQLVAFYFASTIGINIICAVLLFFSGIKRQEVISRSLIFGCVSIIAYQYITWMYHSSSDLENSISLLKIQTGIVIFSMPFYAQVVFLWAKEKIGKTYIFFFSLICVTFFILNLAEPNGLRYLDNIELIEYTVLGNEPVSRLSGDTNPLMLALHLFIGTVVISFVYVVYRSFIKKQLAIVATLILVLVLQAAVVFNAIKIDTGEFLSIYLGAIPFTALNFIACMSIVGALQEKSYQLNAQIGMRKKLESVLAGLARGVSRGDDNTFFVNMMLELQGLTGAKVCCIAVAQQRNERCFVSTKALVFKGRILKNHTIALDDIAKDLIAETHSLWIPDKVCETHPEVPLFKKLNLRSYISVPMLNSDGILEGNLILMFSHAFERVQSLAQVLDVFASRAGAELQRSKVTRQLHRMAYYDYQTKLPNASRANELIDQRTIEI
jgi:hypothetical protein